MATPFNQGAPTVPVVLNTSNCFVFGNTASGNALSVQQLGAGNVATFRTTTGATALFVNAAGNVGIGTASPSTPLDVIGRVRSTQDFMAESTATGGNYSVVRLATGSNGANYIQSAAAQSSGSAAPLVFTGWFGSPEFMRITSTGNVGIGTTNPGYKLDVNGSTRIQGDCYVSTSNTMTLYANTFAFRIADTASGAIGRPKVIINSNGPNAGSPQTLVMGLDGASFGQTAYLDTEKGGVSAVTPLAFRMNGTEYMRVHTNGNVGIGTTSPGSKFEVNGGMYQQGGNAYLGYNSSNQIFLGSNRTGAFCRLNDDAWLGDPQNGTIQFLNGAGAQYGTLIGYLTNASTRASKKDVTTFDQTKLDSLYQDTIKTKVCSWRYKEEADYVPLKYGPILDDSPPYFTVTPDGESLYINQYVAMLHGALQVAIQKIESLETRLSTLENNTTQ